MDGPKRAPSSPPETPVPTYSRPLLSRYLVRRMVSGKCELPPSMIRSPGSRWGSSSSIKSSTALPGLHHQHDLARPLQQADHLFDGVRGDDGFPALGGVVQEFVDLGDGAVVRHHRIAVVVHIEDQVLAHYCQTDQSDVCRLFHEIFTRGRGRFQTSISLITWGHGRGKTATARVLCGSSAASESLPMGQWGVSLLHRIARTIERYGMFRPGMKVGSGRLRRRRFGLPAARSCCEHGLAPPCTASEPQPARRRVARRRGIRAAAGGRFALALYFWRSPLRRRGQNLEQAGREARLAFFREAIAGGMVDRVALGHTRSDQAETVLFRFLRGSGTAGLAGIRPVTADGIVRPLFEVDRADVEQFLRERGIAWREDSTNASADSPATASATAAAATGARVESRPSASALAQAADWALAEEAYWEDGTGPRLAPGAVESETAPFCSHCAPCWRCLWRRPRAAGAAGDRARRRATCGASISATSTRFCDLASRQPRPWAGAGARPGGAPILRLAAVRRAGAGDRRITAWPLPCPGRCRFPVPTWRSPWN